ncbi:ribbon-helix-helix domain-containing protein [Hyalangium versicolor]|uniref:ribbon-helix-helix domain-containing protein n=1 Tax=Hyalangium versicolor TaxID=2861190 RepID=UPI001CC9B489|nr:ribbon-helix-helix domain-containing protein [Hyalangium versicolor]
MQDGNMSPLSSADTTSAAPLDSGERRAGPEADVVSTHVLVSEEQVHKLRELSRRSRIAQSEYLREAVEDLLAKYGRNGTEP